MKRIDAVKAELEALDGSTNARALERDTQLRLKIGELDVEICQELHKRDRKIDKLERKLVELGWKIDDLGKKLVALDRRLVALERRHPAARSSSRPGGEERPGPPPAG